MHGSRTIASRGAGPPMLKSERTMKKTAILAALVAAFSIAAPAHADMSLNAFRQLSAGSKAERFGAEMYVGGVVKGYLNANGYLSASNKPMLFCYKGDFTTGDAYKLASQVVSEHLAQHPGDGKQEIVELLLLMKLRSLYPCA